MVNSLESATQDEDARIVVVAYSLLYEDFRKLVQKDKEFLGRYFKKIKTSKEYETDFNNIVRGYLLAEKEEEPSECMKRFRRNCLYLEKNMVTEQ